jgi:hypothetical protein
MNFQRTTIMVALIVFFLVMIIIGFLLYKSKSTLDYPPEIAECPDYWKVIGVQKCENVKGLGTNCISPMDFSGPEWQGENGLKKKETWATNCGVTWDGVTNNSMFN